ncbi:Alpha/Beta hydrolase protein [Aspergillus lucknowensis]|uniref:Alpha/Beta hydrolase protein n=1 Tax=Aspergillus lucknowensis TaxID=176173 RepID=A0ABR4L5K2_9EURO
MHAYTFLATASLITATSAASLGAFNVDPGSVSVSGFSSGGFMAAQLGVAYSSTFQTGFGVFSGGPYDCARNQYYTNCMYNLNPSITTPTANIKSWSGNQIDTITNLKSRKIYMQAGSADTTVGPNVMAKLNIQLSNFGSASNLTYVSRSGAAHTFPTDFDAQGDNSCTSSSSPYVSNCGYDGAGAVLQWMYGTLNARNTGTLTGEVISFDQTSSYGANGMATTGYLYVPATCKDGSTICRLHVALHGCSQSYGQIGSKFITNTGYNKWADTNNIIMLYPQTTQDNSFHTIWNGGLLSNSNGCWDWLGWYGTNADQKGGAQMTAIVNQVSQIISG